MLYLTAFILPLLIAVWWDGLCFAALIHCCFYLWYQVLRDIWKKDIKCPYNSLGAHPLVWLARWALDKSGDFLEPRCSPVCAVNLGDDKGPPPPYLVADVSIVISSLRAPGEWELLGRNRDAENGLVGPAGGGEGGMNGESGTDVCPRVKQTGSGKLLGSIGSPAWCSMIT